MNATKDVAGTTRVSNVMTNSFQFDGPYRHRESAPVELLEHEPAIPRVIWLYWDQGYPTDQVLQRVWKSWADLNPTWEIRTVDSVSISFWLKVGDVRRALKMKKLQARSDLVRVALLERHGGVWADADAYCVIPLDSWIHAYVRKSGFFAFSLRGRDRPVSSWFLASLPKSTLISKWKRAIFAHAKRHRRFQAYLQFHYEFKNLLEVDSEFERLWNDTPRVNATISEHDKCCVPVLSHENTLPRVAVRREQNAYLGKSTHEFDTLISSGKLPVLKGNTKDDVEYQQSHATFLDVLDKHTRSKLPGPLVINLGMPKTGTTSLTKYFKQLGIECAHWKTKDKRIIGEAMTSSLHSKKPIFKDLPNVRCLTQMDFCRWTDKKRRISECFWPQIDMLQTLVKRFPSAKFILTTRNVDSWFDSVSRWSDLLDRIRCSSSSLLRYNATDEEVKTWFVNHTNSVKAFVESKNLMELTLEAAQTQAEAVKSFVFGNEHVSLPKSEYPKSNINKKRPKKQVAKQQHYS